MILSYRRQLKELSVADRFEILRLRSIVERPESITLGSSLKEGYDIQTGGKKSVGVKS